MELGEIRQVTFKLSGAVGINSINSAEITSDTLTVGTASASGTSVACLLTASRTGTHKVKCTAVLSSAETIIGVVRVKVIDSTNCDSASDYR